MRSWSTDLSLVRVMIQLDREEAIKVKHLKSLAVDASSSEIDQLTDDLELLREEQERFRVACKNFDLGK